MSGEMLVGCAVKEPQVRYSAAYPTGERAWGGRTFCHGVTPWSRGDWSVRGSGTGVREPLGLECTRLSDWSARVSRTGVYEPLGLECASFADWSACGLCVHGVPMGKGNSTTLNSTKGVRPFGFMPRQNRETAEDANVRYSAAYPTGAERVFI